MGASGCFNNDMKQDGQPGWMVVREGEGAALLYENLHRYIWFLFVTTGSIAACQRLSLQSIVLLVNTFGYSGCVWIWVRLSIAGACDGLRGLVDKQSDFSPTARSVDKICHAHIFPSYCIYN